MDGAASQQLGLEILLLLYFCGHLIHTSRYTRDKTCTCHMIMIHVQPLDAHVADELVVEEKRIQSCGLENTLACIGRRILRLSFATKHLACFHPKVSNGRSIVPLL